jgi:hypothetical protein
MWSESISIVALLAQRPPPDWQNSFWASPLGMLILFAFVLIGGWLSKSR